MIVKRLILLLFILFPFGQLTRLPLPVSPSIRMYAHDVIVILLIGTWLVHLIRQRKKILYPPAFKYITYFIATAILSLSLNTFRYPFIELLTGSVYLFRWTAYTSIYVLIYNVAHEDKKFAKTLLLFLAGAGVVSAVFGLTQYFLYPNLRNLMYLGWDPHEFRVFGTFFDSGFTGLIYVMTLMLLAYRWTFNRSNWLLLTGAAITYVALALTYSRASFVALFAGFFVISLFKKSIKPVAVVTAILILTLFLLPQPSPTAEGTKLERTSSVDARLTNYEQSLEIIKDNPIFGIGFNMLRYENRNRNFVPEYEWEESNAAAGLDNSFLFIWATTGIIGLISYVYLLYKTAVLAINKQQLTMQSLSILVISSLAAILVHSMFNNSLFYPWIMIWLWVLFGVAHVARRL